jgi:hypothetical protein
MELPIYKRFHISRLIYDFLFMDIDKIFLFSTLEWYNL